ncbi:phage tail tube protein [Anaeromicropila herbilytica]|uniref:Phage portal protein n=1 Tax=Anaeromicropila herbilytica TaxID=2785025 RepID=A0A7R7ENF1_9FIRM|nr:phage tail tube protein [Anaeromicropila herbilytica]BCN32070.1 hypothetical protein bsdtb5_33650 [Anaeromicropila herbilytica]
MGYQAREVINGSYGKIWIDNHEVGEVLSFKATVTPKTETVSQIGKLVDGTKIVGLECKGELKANKINSRFIQLLSDDLRKGKAKTFTLISQLSDPDSRGTEKVALTGCTFTDLDLSNWENKKLTEESMSFNFEDWKFFDTIEV